MQKNSKRKYVIIGGMALVLAAAVLLLTGMRNREEAEALGGETATAFVGDLSASATASGTLLPSRASKLSADRPGRVDSVAVQVGDRVQAGDELVQLETDDLILSVTLSDQNLKMKEANLVDLLAGASQAQIASAEAAVASAQAQLDDLLEGPSAEELAALEAELNSAEANTWSSSAQLRQTQNAVKADDIAAAEQSIQSIHDRLMAGEDFTELAITSSDGQNALEGGRLGWRKGAQLPDVFFDVVRDMNPGDISPPVRSPSGLHVLRLNDVRGAERVIELQHHTYHILLRPDQVLDDRAVKSKLDRIRKRIVEDGEDFSDVARLESDDPGSAPLGGDLGWNAPGTFVPAFEDVVANIQPGEVSEPFRTEFGWHIVLLADRQERDTTEEVKRSRAIDAIRASKQEQETEIWLRQLRDEAYVEIRG